MTPWLCALLVLGAGACSKKNTDPPSTKASSTRPTTVSTMDAGMQLAPSASNLSPIPAGSRQLLVTITADWKATDATLLRFERNADGAWQAIGTAVPSTVGKTGLAWGLGVQQMQPASGEPVKLEGDGKSPAGVFAIGSAYGYEPAVATTRLPYQQSDKSWRCVNDSSSQYYNRVLDSSQVEVDWQEAEKMRRRDELYRLVIEVDHNRIVPSEVSPVAQGGSCIFLHVWRKAGAPTIGCTAMSLTNMEMLMAWLDPTMQPHLVALPQTTYEALRERWRLPALP